MPMPTDVGIIDLMLGIPSPDQPSTYDFMRPLFRDKESLEQFDFPVEYMFKDVPKFGRASATASSFTLEQMDAAPHRAGADRRLPQENDVAAAVL